MEEKHARMLEEIRQFRERLRSLTPEQRQRVGEALKGRSGELHQLTEALQALKKAHPERPEAPAPSASIIAPEAASIDPSLVARTFRVPSFRGVARGRATLPAVIERLEELRKDSRVDALEPFEQMFIEALALCTEKGYIDAAARLALAGVERRLTGLLGTGNAQRHDTGLTHAAETIRDVLMEEWIEHDQPIRPVTDSAFDVLPRHRRDGGELGLAELSDAIDLVAWIFLHGRPV